MQTYKISGVIKARVDVTSRFDSGRTFSAALRVDAESQPWGDAGSPAGRLVGDCARDNYVFVTWADVRSGESAGFRSPPSARGAE